MLSRQKNFNSELEAKFIQDRLTFTERTFAELCQIFAAYTRKSARLRDKNDELATFLQTYSNNETVNRSLSDALCKFSATLTTVGAFGDKRVQNIDAKVVATLSHYEEICKGCRDEVKQIFIARDKEVLKKRQLDRIKERNPRNRQQIIQAETDLVQANSEVVRTVHKLEEQIANFERQKLHDLKSVLLEFIRTEIAYNAKSLELLSEAYKDIKDFDEEEDLQDLLKVTGEMESEFKKSLRLVDTVQQTRSHKTKTSLGSLSSIFSTPKKAPGIPDDYRKAISKSDNELNQIKRSEVYDTTEDSQSENSDTQTSLDSSPVTTKVAAPFLAKQFAK